MTPAKTTTIGKKRLKPNAELFCIFFAETRNATESYKRAYTKNRPTRATCGSNSAKLLKNTAIRERINGLIGEIILDAHIKPVQILNEFADLAFANVGDMVDKDFNLKPLKKLSKGQQKSIRKIKKTTTFRYGKDGEKIGGKEIVEVELYDRTKALEKLAEYTGVLEPEKMTQIFMQVNNQNNNTVTLNPDDIPLEQLEKLIDQQTIKGVIKDD